MHNKFSNSFVWVSPSTSDAVISQALEGKPSNRFGWNSFQSNSLSILVLFLEIETFLLITGCDYLDFLPDLFIAELSLTDDLQF